MYFHVIHKMNFLNKINAIITFPLDYETILVRIFFYASFQEFYSFEFYKILHDDKTFQMKTYY